MAGIVRGANVPVQTNAQREHPSEIRITERQAAFVYQSALVGLQDEVFAATGDAGINHVSARSQQTSLERVRAQTQFRSDGQTRTHGSVVASSVAIAVRTVGASSGAVPARKPGPMKPGRNGVVTRVMERYGVETSRQSDFFSGLNVGIQAARSADAYIHGARIPIVAFSASDVRFAPISEQGRDRTRQNGEKYDQHQNCEYDFENRRTAFRFPHPVHARCACEREASSKKKEEE